MKQILRGLTLHDSEKDFTPKVHYFKWKSHNHIIFMKRNCLHLYWVVHISDTRDTPHKPNIGNLATLEVLKCSFLLWWSPTACAFPSLFQMGSRRFGNRFTDAVLGRCFQRRRKKLSAVGSLLNVEECDRNGTSGGVGDGWVMPSRGPLRVLFNI